MKESDEAYMRLAIQEAKNGFDRGEVPVGAVLVFQNQVVAAFSNQVESLMDATAHAEMLCLKKGFSVLKNWRLMDCVLYTTLEPCPMCAGALISSRIKRVVWGAPDLRQGAGGSLISLLGQKHPIHTVEVSSNVLGEESSHLMKLFFQRRRAWKKSLKISLNSNT
ncbi:tRNA-specific adenosine deaminase [Rhabdochlamydiaceae symbiont of Dictyostelium giganteum]